MSCSTREGFIFFLSFLDNKMSILGEYGAFKTADCIIQVALQTALPIVDGNPVGSDFSTM